jgi:hypothetical protein
MIEQARHRETIADLVSPNGGLRLGRIYAIDRPRVKPEISQTRFRDLDIS